jgi:hypothetical protein
MPTPAQPIRRRQCGRHSSWDLTPVSPDWIPAKWEVPLQGMRGRAEKSDERCIERTDARTLAKTAVLVNNYSSISIPHRPAGQAGFFCCDFWRSRRRHIWGRPRRPYHGLGRPTDVKAMLSPYRIEVDINRQNLCVELAGIVIRRDEHVARAAHEVGRAGSASTLRRMRRSSRRTSSSAWQNSRTSSREQRARQARPGWAIWRRRSNAQDKGQKSRC